MVSDVQNIVAQSAKAVTLLAVKEPTLFCNITGWQWQSVLITISHQKPDQ